MKHKITVVLAPCILPFAIIWLVICLKRVKGPFYMMGDPDYAYLLNALNILTGQAPAHVEHPGTSLQMLGAFILWISHRLFGVMDVTSDVLTRPEFYLGIFHMVLLGLLSLSLYFVGFVAFLFTRRWWVATLLQLTPLFSPTLIVQYLRVYPETLLLVFVYGLFIVFLCVFKYGFYEYEYRMAVFLAVVTGCGLAAKITFIPVVLIPLFLLPRWTSRIVYIIGSIVGFVIFTIPIIHHYTYILEWLQSILFHVGRYGQGEQGIISSDGIIPSIRNMFNSEPTLFIVLATGIILLGVVTVFDREWIRISYRLRILLGMVMAQVLQITMVVKHPGDNRYLLPCLGLSAFLLWLILDQLQEQRRRWVRGVAFLLVLAVISASAHSWSRFNFKLWVSEHETKSTQFGSLYYFANYWSGNHYTEQLKKIYEQELHSEKK